MLIPFVMLITTRGAMRAYLINMGSIQGNINVSAYILLLADYINRWLSGDYPPEVGKGRRYVNLTVLDMLFSG
jgi:hypothetical protein